MNDKMSQGIPREGYNPIPEKGSMNPRPPIPPLPLPKLGAQPGNQNAKIPFPEFNKDWTPAQMEIWFKFRKEEIVR